MMVILNLAGFIKTVDVHDEIVNKRQPIYWHVPDHRQGPTFSRTLDDDTHRFDFDHLSTYGHNWCAYYVCDGRWPKEDADG